MIDSLGSIVLQNIEVSILQAVLCHYCANQNVKADAYILFSKEHKKTNSKNYVRVMCENGHIFVTPLATIRTVNKQIIGL